MIYNKSSHPIEVKKISIRLWTLRDEIEAAIARRMKECEAAGIPLYIEDIKEFYNLDRETKLTDNSNVLQLPSKDDGVTELMESIGEETKAEETPAPVEAAPVEAAPVEAAPVEATPVEAAPVEADPEVTAAPEGEASPSEENKTFVQAEEIMAEQKLQGLETKKPNPILDRPYQRQAPDLDKVSYGFSLLSDVNMDHFLCFAKNNFLQGQSVVIEFLIPQHFMMTAEVNYCNYYARTSKIISSTKPDYRVQCRFIYAIPGERDNLRKFLVSIEPTVPDNKKKPKKVAEDDSLGL